MARTKIKSEKSESKQIDSLERRRSNGGKIVVLSIITLAVIGVFIYQSWDKAQEVEVIQLSRNVTAGDMVDQSNIRSERIRKEQYAKDMIDFTDEEGRTTKVHSRVLYSERDKYIGQFYNYYQSENSSFVVSSCSKEMQYKNPMIENMERGHELYSLPISAEDLDMNQLFPSSTLRMRIAIQVPFSEYAECVRIASTKQVYDGSSSVLKYLASKGFAVSASGVTGGGGAVDEAVVADERKQTVSEVILKDIVAVDMQSSSGESIYEVYMALMRMSVKDRIPYLKTSFEDDISGSFRTRVTPKALDLDLTLDQATRMHEYEEMGYSVKYTLVKTDTSSDMLKNFTEINSQIVEQLNKAGGK